MVERVYSVDTPENLALSFERAGLATRALALCVDLAVMALVMQGALWALAAVELVASSAATALWIIAGFVVQWGYGVACEWKLSGQTLGKRLCRIAVVDASGLRLSFAQAALRNLLRLADLLPGLHLVGALVALLDPHGRRLGDLAARTVVVRDQRAEPSRLAESPRAENLPIVTPLIRNIRPVERRALLALCAELDALPITERVTLCSALSNHFVERYALRVPEHTSPERLLLLLQGALSSVSAPLARRTARFDATPNLRSRAEPRSPYES